MPLIRWSLGPPCLLEGKSLGLDFVSLRHETVEPRIYTIDDFVIPPTSASPSSGTTGDLDDEWGFADDTADPDAAASGRRIRHSFRVERSRAGRWRFTSQGEKSKVNGLLVTPVLSLADNENFPNPFMFGDLLIQVKNLYYPSVHLI